MDGEPTGARSPDVIARVPIDVGQGCPVSRAGRARLDEGKIRGCSVSLVTQYDSRAPPAGTLIVRVIRL
jgi:hypothetical protein